MSPGRHQDQPKKICKIQVFEKFYDLMHSHMWYGEEAHVKECTYLQTDLEGGSVHEASFKGYLCTIPDEVQGDPDQGKV